MAPGIGYDEQFIDGLPVGSFFSFAWNGIVSMAFQLVGFLLTYLLHTTHAARNGSRAGLGITLINYGFGMRSSSSTPKHPSENPGVGPPANPNIHDFDPSTVSGVDNGSGSSNPVAAGGLHANDWLSYLLMIAGWIMLIKAITDFIRVRRLEQLALQQNPNGGAGAIIVDGENAETVV